MKNGNNTYDTHPAAQAFPLLPAGEFEALKQDIATRGMRQPILLKGNTIIDGRNRYAAAQELKLKPDQIPFEEYEGADEVGEIIAQNVLRRHLTDDQRVAIVAKLRAADMSQEATDAKQAGLAKGRKGGTTGKAGGETAERIAKEAKTTEHKGRAAVAVAKHAPEQLDAVIAGKAKLASAKKQADITKLEKAKASGKTAKPKKEKPLTEVVEAKFLRFMDFWPVTVHREVKAHLRTLLAP